MYKEFPIYFSNLNKETQKKLLDFVGVKEPCDMNWDVDMAPIAMYPFEDKSEEGSK